MKAVCGRCRKNPCVCGLSEVPKELERQISGEPIFGPIPETYAELNKRYAKAAAELEALQKDKERLDWGEKNFARVALGTPQLVGEKWTIFGPSDDGSDDVEGNTLREAIDAAISAEKK